MIADTCPFCGKQPGVHPERPDLQGDSWAIVKCFNKKCPLDVSITVYSDHNPREKAIKKWNKRASIW